MHTFLVSPSQHAIKRSSQLQHTQQIMSCPECPIPLAKDIYTHSRQFESKCMHSQHIIQTPPHTPPQTPHQKVKKENKNLHIPKLKQQIPTCTLPTTTKILFGPPLLITNQSYPLKVSAKLNTFLKIIKHVNPSIATSLCASTRYNELATAPHTIPAVTNANATQGASQWYL